ncbi:nucleic acid-binding protein [Schizopora paradoxa]|uniref:Nucleic acid-binding protein n=1 Tax=Schizopora paradoxa TaxID=27342 RepID=A0A0H2R541_9AGAM|nr:nucleic acid-binding protein [Schizopora paradoxa]
MSRPPFSMENATVVPVTVKQCKEAQYDEATYSFSFLPSRDTLVKIVGQVVEYEREVSYDKYILDDATGLMEVRHYTGRSPEKVEEADIEKGLYVRALGSLRVYNEVRSVNANHVRRCESNVADELFHHYLEVMYHIAMKRSRPPSDPPAAPVPELATGSRKRKRLSGLERLIFVYCEAQPESENGIPLVEIVNAIVHKLKYQVDSQQFSTAFDFLEENGFLYTTIDNHFKLAV